PDVVGGDVEGIDPLSLHVPEEVHQIPTVGFDRVVGQEGIADPGDDRSGGGGSVSAGSNQGLGQEGSHFVGGRGGALEDVTPLGDKGSSGGAGSASGGRMAGTFVGDGM